MSDWKQITKRTNDPKLRHFETLLDEAGILHRRHGESFHAPILQVPAAQHDDAWEILTSDVFGDGQCYDEIEDDDPVFGELFYEE